MVNTQAACMYTVGERRRPADLFQVEWQCFPEEEEWQWIPFYRVSMCLIRRFVNLNYCSEHEAILVPDSDSGSSESVYIPTKDRGVHYESMSRGISHMNS